MASKVTTQRTRPAVHYHALWAAQDGASLAGHAVLIKRPEVDPPGSTLVECSNTLCYTLTLIAGNISTLVQMQMQANAHRTEQMPVSLPNLKVR